MTDQAKAGDIGHGVNAEFSPLNYFRRCFVKRSHRLNCAIDPCLFGLAFFYRRGDHARTQRLGEDESISGLGASVGKDLLWVADASDGVSELGFLVAEAGAANHAASDFNHFRKAACEHALR